jgi:threonine/homoserine/homoserine lactone efflux protein
MPYLTEFLTVAFIHFLGVMSPGPDFAMISRNSLVYSRRTGIYSAFGLALGILVHVTYSLIGIGLIISKSIIIFSTIKLLGASYLIYIGYKALRTKSHNLKSKFFLAPN